MGSFNISIPRSGRSLAETLGRLPPAFKDQAQNGFVVLAGLHPQHFAAILTSVIGALESKRAPLEYLERNLSLPPSELGALFAAAMLMVPILAEVGKADEFVELAVKTELLPRDLAGKIQPFIDAVVLQRSQIQRAIRRAELQTQALPSLTRMELAIDLRVAFDDDHVTDAVPVVVIYVATDADGGEIWFQASKQQMQDLKNDVDEAIRKMDIAEAWGGRETEK